MKSDSSEHPACFGVLEQVFPKSEDGLRQSPERCMNCRLKVDCLRAAVSGPEGNRVREEVIDRAYGTGVISFFERWSKKKYFRGRLKKETEKTQKEGGVHEDD
ncbi:MAG: hypothetical protein P1P89_13005 [Desulfobacterales bacterium]|nr:hypothetical protein [Desulfobacterales bacterium]